MGVLFFMYGLSTFIIPYTDASAYPGGIPYAAQYMILGILLVGSGAYINNKRGWASRYSKPDPHEK